MVTTDRNYYQELKEKLIKADTNPAHIDSILNWLMDVVNTEYQHGSDDAAAIYNEKIKK